MSDDQREQDWAEYGLMTTMLYTDPQKAERQGFDRGWTYGYARGKAARHVLASLEWAGPDEPEWGVWTRRRWGWSDVHFIDQLIEQCQAEGKGEAVARLSEEREQLVDRIEAERRPTCLVCGGVRPVHAAGCALATALGLDAPPR